MFMTHIGQRSRLHDKFVCPLTPAYDSCISILTNAFYLLTIYSLLIMAIGVYVWKRGVHFCTTNANAVKFIYQLLWYILLCYILLNLI